MLRSVRKPSFPGISRAHEGAAWLAVSSTTGCPECCPGPTRQWPVQRWIPVRNKSTFQWWKGFTKLLVLCGNELQSEKNNSACFSERVSAWRPRPQNKNKPGHSEEGCLPVMLRRTCTSHDDVRRVKWGGLIKGESKQDGVAWRLLF